MKKWNRRILCGLLAIGLLLSMGAANAAITPERAGALPDGAFLSTMTGGNTIGGVIREEKPRADGFRHIDTPAMIEKLKRLRVTTYTYGVWDMASDWDDLTKEFAPAAKDAGIDIMVYIVPPSECFLHERPHLDGRCSRPYNKDYITWAREIAKLSKTYDNVKSWGIDDFLIGQNGELFTKEYIDAVRAASDEYNPDLKWYVTLYFSEVNDHSIGLIKDSLDGVIYPYLGHAANTVDPTWTERRTDALLAKLRPAGLDLVFLLYAGRGPAAVNEPDETYAADVLARVRPYLEDGRVAGFISYATPMRHDLHHPSNEYLARSGSGRLSFTANDGQPTADGAYTDASQTIQVDQNAPSKKLTFHHYDQYKGGLTGYQFEQVLVDDQVVWESDVSNDLRWTWEETAVDLTEALAGKTEAKLTFRLFHKKAIGNWMIDVVFDDVAGEGITVQNGGFESRDGWQLGRNHDALQPMIDLYAPDRPIRIFNAVGSAYAAMRGVDFTPEPARDWPDLRIGPENKAMFGNGRLSLFMPQDTPAPAGTCAKAWQDVAVTPGLPRYELSFWHMDPWQGVDEGYQHKKIYIDGQELWKRTTADFWPWGYFNGSDHQGVIDVTEFVQGKEKVRLEFQMCNDRAVQSFGMDTAIDHIETIGLDVKNADFETTDGWQLAADAPLKAEIAIAP